VAELESARLEKRATSGAHLGHLLQLQAVERINLASCSVVRIALKRIASGLFRLARQDALSRTISSSKISTEMPPREAWPCAPRLHSGREGLPWASRRWGDSFEKSHCAHARVCLWSPGPGERTRRPEALSSAGPNASRS
jgi:hypothetical protein